MTDQRMLHILTATYNNGSNSLFRLKLFLKVLGTRKIMTEELIWNVLKPRNSTRLFPKGPTTTKILLVQPSAFYFSNQEREKGYVTHIKVTVDIRKSSNFFLFSQVNE